MLFSVGTTRRPGQREQACAAAERYHKDSSIPQVLAVVELNVAEALHNGDVEEDRQVDRASFQVPFGHEGEDESGLIAVLVPHMVGDGTQVSLSTVVWVFMRST